MVNACSGGCLFDYINIVSDHSSFPLYHMYFPILCSTGTAKTSLNFRRTSTTPTPASGTTRLFSPSLRSRIRPVVRLTSTHSVVTETMDRSGKKANFFQAVTHNCQFIGQYSTTFPSLLFISI
jgi:hypothetical protein